MSACPDAQWCTVLLQCMRVQIPLAVLTVVVKPISCGMPFGSLQCCLWAVQLAGGKPAVCWVSN